MVNPPHSPADQRFYFHLAPMRLGRGSIIKAGNYGRIVKMYGWGHGQALREYALEAARQRLAPMAPSRATCAFSFVTQAAALQYRADHQDGFRLHVMHQVTLSDPNEMPFLCDHRKVGHSAPFEQWPDVYWMGIGAGAPEDFLYGEVLSRSDLIVHGCLE